MTMHPEDDEPCDSYGHPFHCRHARSRSPLSASAEADLQRRETNVIAALGELLGVASLQINARSEPMPEIEPHPLSAQAAVDRGAGATVPQVGDYVRKTGGSASGDDSRCPWQRGKPGEHVEEVTARWPASGEIRLAGCPVNHRHSAHNAVCQILDGCAQHRIVDSYGNHLREFPVPSRLRERIDAELATLRETSPPAPERTAWLPATQETIGHNVALFGCGECGAVHHSPKLHKVHCPVQRSRAKGKPRA